MKVLVTGGAGYIGSTVCSALEDAGHTAVVLDSLVTGRREFVRGRPFYEADIGNRRALEGLFADHPDVACTVHCAALVVVPDSVADPRAYYRENVVKSLALFRHLADLGRPRLVFSSSASVYDATAGGEVTEDSPLRPTSPYARTKAVTEMALEDFCHAYGLRGLSLRYFNPIGADPWMRSGVHVAQPSHVLGKLVEVALGRLPVFELTGTAWPTRDGSGLRDYVHVWDLARAHVSAVERFDSLFGPPHGVDGYRVLNLGTGSGVTVRELVKAFERVFGRPVPTRDAPPRPGDSGGAFANADRARELLGWSTTLSLEQAIGDALEWDRVRPFMLEIGPHRAPGGHSARP